MIMKTIIITVLYAFGSSYKNSLLISLFSCRASSPEQAQDVLCCAISINTCQSHFCFPVRCYMPQSWIPNCLLLSRDSHSAGWIPRRNDRVSSPLGDAPTVWENAPGWRVCFSGPGYRLSRHRGLIVGREWKPYRKWHCGRRRICPSCVHKSEPDNCPGGELRADWLQCHRRPVPQCAVVQLPWKPPGHGNEW